MGLEGIVSKRRDAPLPLGRDECWRKTKCVRSSRFTIVGYLPEGEKKRVGAVLLAEERDGRLVYVGNAGLGLTMARAAISGVSLTRYAGQNSPARASLTGNTAQGAVGRAAAHR